MNRQYLVNFLVSVFLSAYCVDLMGDASCMNKYVIPKQREGAREEHEMVVYMEFDLKIRMNVRFTRKSPFLFSLSFPSCIGFLFSSSPSPVSPQRRTPLQKTT